MLMQPPGKSNQNSAENVGGVKALANHQADERDAGIANLTLLLEKQKLREKSVHQLSMVGNIHQSEQIATERHEGESNEEFIKRYTSQE